LSLGGFDYGYRQDAAANRRQVTVAHKETISLIRLRHRVRVLVACAQWEPGNLPLGPDLSGRLLARRLEGLNNSDRATRFSR
jgi:hypothetical protein